MRYACCGFRRQSSLEFVPAKADRHGETGGSDRPGHSAGPDISRDISKAQQAEEIHASHQGSRLRQAAYSAIARAQVSAVSAFTLSGMPSCSSPVAVTTRKASSTSRKALLAQRESPKAVVRREAISMMQSMLASSMKGSIPVVGCHRQASM